MSDTTDPTRPTETSESPPTPTIPTPTPRAWSDDPAFEPIHPTVPQPPPAPSTPDPRLDGAVRFVTSLQPVASLAADTGVMRVNELRCVWSETSSRWPSWSMLADTIGPSKAPAEGTITGLAVAQFIDLLRSSLILSDERDRLNGLLVDANGEITRLNDTVAGLAELNALNHHAADHPLDPELVGDEPPVIDPVEFTEVTAVAYESPEGWLNCPYCEAQTRGPNRETALLDHLRQYEAVNRHQPATHIHVVPWSQPVPDPG